jgi:hypothetical protein
MREAIVLLQVQKKKKRKGENGIQRKEERKEGKKERKKERKKEKKKEKERKKERKKEKRRRECKSGEKTEKDRSVYILYVDADRYSSDDCHILISCTEILISCSDKNIEEKTKSAKQSRRAASISPSSTRALQPRRTAKQ